MPNITGKVILVVGGSGKIGLPLCKGLINAGATVVSLSRKGNKISHPRLINKIVDATSNSEVRATLECVDAEIGPISALVNCACYRPLANQNQSPVEIDILHWSNSILQNSLLLHIPSSLIADYMKEKNIQGSIVTISSIYGINAPNFSVYKNTSMTTEPDYAYNKSAAIGYSRYMASKYSEFNIRFNIIAPGGFLDGQEVNFVKNYSENVPLSRMGSYEDIFGLVQYLCSDSSSYMTGAVIPLDGGWSLI